MLSKSSNPFLSKSCIKHLDEPSDPTTTELAAFFLQNGMVETKVKVEKLLFDHTKEVVAYAQDLAEQRAEIDEFRTMVTLDAAGYTGCKTFEEVEQKIFSDGQASRQNIANYLRDQLQRHGMSTRIADDFEQFTQRLTA